jgi:hypothetical protein
MARRAMQRLGMVLLIGCASTPTPGVQSPGGSKLSTVNLGRAECKREPNREMKPPHAMCRVGDTFIVRFADSTGVGEGFHPSGPKMVALAIMPCVRRSLSGRSAPLECTMGDQNFVYDSTGVGEGQLPGSVSSDSAGVGEGLFLTSSNCQWVVISTYKPYPVLECFYGPLAVVVDSAGVGEGRVSGR